MGGGEASRFSHNLVGFGGGAPSMASCPPEPHQRKAGSGSLHAVMLPAHPFSPRHADAAAALHPGEKTPKASLQAHRSWHSSTQSSTGMPIALKSAHTHSSHLMRGLPLDGRLFTPYSDIHQNSATCGSLPCFMRPTCPNHLSLLVEMMVARVVDPHFALTCALCDDPTT